MSNPPHLVIFKASVAVQLFAAAAELRFSHALRILFVDRQIMFLICSHSMLSSNHEQSILTCAQAPAGPGALQTGGCAFGFAGACSRHRSRTAARPGRAIQRQWPL